MVGVELKGRLGNQFFHYAFARYVLYKRGDKENLIIGDYFLRKQSSEQGWKNCLGDFNVHPFIEEHNSIILKRGNFFLKILYYLYFFDVKFVARNKSKAQKRWKRLLWENGLIVNTSATIRDNIPIPQNENIYLDGVFENPNFFCEIRNIIQNEFTPIHPPIESNKKLYEIIQNTNSVCVTIRRGDYLSSEFKEGFYICTPQYFNKAIDTIIKLIDNPVFIFFSDDIAWTKINFNLPYPCYFESGNDPLWEKIRLMYSCKHFIISNSTFSWIAQYLCRNEEKIVISPSRWHNFNDSALLEDTFIKINPE